LPSTSGGYSTTSRPSEPVHQFIKQSAQLSDASLSLPHKYDGRANLRAVAATSGWNEPALCTLFRIGLRKEVQMELACRDVSLDALIEMAIRLDNLLWERRYPHCFSPCLSDHSVSEPEP
jgi:hypothetical protein